jgi:hypothetical protein
MRYLTIHGLTVLNFDGRNFKGRKQRDEFMVVSVDSDPGRMTGRNVRLAPHFSLNHA